MSLVPMRFVVVLMAFLGLMNIYIMRTNLSVAILPISKAAGWDTVSGAKRKGTVLSAFFWGYLVTQFVGSVLALRFGAKRTLMYCLLGTSVVTALLPTMAKESYLLLVVARVITGLCQGSAYPATTQLLSHWLPSGERTRLASFVYSGATVGIIATLPAAGAVCDDPRLGWEWVFYGSAALGLVWVVLWLLLVSDSPSTSGLISEGERDFLVPLVVPLPKRGAQRPSFFSSSNLVDYKRIMCSGPVWALVVQVFVNTWTAYYLLTWLPTYLNEMFNYNAAKSGLFSVLPYLAMAALTYAAGYGSDWLRSSGALTTTQTRKLFGVTCNTIPAGLMIWLGFVDTPTLGIGLVVAIVGLGGLGTASHIVNPLDLGSRHASFIMALANSFGTLGGIISPQVVGAMVGEKTRKEWQAVFAISAALFLFGAVVYGTWATGEPIFAQAELSTVPGAKEALLSDEQEE